MAPLLLVTESSPPSGGLRKTVTATALIPVLSPGEARKTVTATNAAFVNRILQRDAVARQLELELIQTQMAQKPMLRAEVYAHAMRASQNRKKEVRREKEV